MSRPTLYRDHSSTTTHPPPRSHVRRTRLVLLLVVALLAVGGGAVAFMQLRDPDASRTYLSTNGWPQQGQGAYQLGDETPRASKHQRPVPIASLAKVMTALVVLEARPLREDAGGPGLVVTAADVADYESRRAQDQSVVAVRAGERLTERQALTAVLLPSANNVAVLLARFAAGGVDAFVRRMNATARRLGMHDTYYTDPSGFAWSTVSSATDQLLLARVAARQPVLADLMGSRQARLPVAGTLYNTDTLLGTDGFAGMKTGSDDAAGGCFMFRSQRLVHGHRVDVIGVVLGQQGDNLIRAGLYSARQLVDRVAPVAATI